MCVFPVSISGFIKFVVVIDNSVVTTQLPRIGVLGVWFWGVSPPKPHPPEASSPWGGSKGKSKVSTRPQGAPKEGVGSRSWNPRGFPEIVAGMAVGVGVWVGVGVSVGKAVTVGVFDGFGVVVIYTRTISMTGLPALAVQALKNKTIRRIATRLMFIIQRRCEKGSFYPIYHRIISRCEQFQQKPVTWSTEDLSGTTRVFIGNHDLTSWEFEGSIWVHFVCIFYTHLQICVLFEVLQSNGQTDLYMEWKIGSE